MKIIKFVIKSIFIFIAFVVVFELLLYFFDLFGIGHQISSYGCSSYFWPLFFCRK